MMKIKDAIEALKKAVKGQAEVTDKMQNELLDLYIEINRLQHRVKELEDDGK